MTETRHILRSEWPATNAVAKLFAARNEWASFQILLRSEQPVEGIDVEAGDLRGPNGFVLHGADSRLYREHQLHLTAGTYRNDSFKADWYPDPLIPFRNPVTGERLEGPRFKAAPFDLPARETHGFWVDLYVPSNTPPGDYREIYRVTARGGESRDIGVSLKVWNFALPQTPTLVTAFGSPHLREYYQQQAKETHGPEPSDWPAVQDQVNQLLSEHRFNAVPPAEMLAPVAQADGSFLIPSRQVRLLQEFIDRYHVNALQTPHPESVIKDPGSQQDLLRAWLQAFDQAANELEAARRALLHLPQGRAKHLGGLSLCAKVGPRCARLQIGGQGIGRRAALDRTGLWRRGQRVGRSLRRGGHLVSAFLPAPAGQRGRPPGAG